MKESLYAPKLSWAWVSYLFYNAAEQFLELLDFRNLTIIDSIANLELKKELKIALFLKTVTNQKGFFAWFWSGNAKNLEFCAHIRGKIWF